MKKDKNCMKKNVSIWLLPLVTALLILCLACSGSGSDKQIGGVPEASAETEDVSVITPEPDLHREELDAILKRVTMLDGVTINGVNVGGMTKEEAKAAVLPSLEAMQKDLRVEVTLGDTVEIFSGETVAADSDLDAAINDAFALVREDIGFEAVSAQVEEIKTKGRDFPVHLSFNEASLRKSVNAFADAHDTQPVDASVGYNKEENQIDFTPDVPGCTVNREALLAALLSAKSGDTIEAPAENTPAEVTLEAVQQQYVLRGTFTTKFSKSKSNRKFNICHGAELITGTILHPGDVFSANGTLGIRNKDNGWKIAGAYVQGKHDQQYGGGVCQLSSTLLNAAIIADMKIVKRQNHSMKVDYVGYGLDATINSVGNIIDFKFQNSSKQDILIIARTDGSSKNYKNATTLTMEIWGIPVVEDSGGAYDKIVIETPIKISRISPKGEVKYSVDETKPVGYKKQVAKKIYGYIYDTYIQYYLNGVQVNRIKLFRSEYKAYAGEYVVGPDAKETATPKPSSSGGSKTPKPTTPDPTDPDEPDTPKPTAPPENTPEPPEDTPKPTAEPPEDTPAPTDSSSGDDDGEE